MIRKDEIIMEAKKKEIAVEELKKQCEEAKNKFETLYEQLKIAEKEEAERKEAELALKKEARKAEVDKAYETYRKLVNAYVNDYGSYSTVDGSDGVIAGLFSRSWWNL